MERRSRDASKPRRLSIERRQAGKQLASSWQEAGHKLARSWHEAEAGRLAVGCRLSAVGIWLSAVGCWQAGKKLARSWQEAGKKLASWQVGCRLVSAVGCCRTGTEGASQHQALVSQTTPSSTTQMLTQSRCMATPSATASSHWQ
eukprot:COSAG02_NODE_3186_length_7217_cov_3.288848_6_plen_145_part_00